MCMRNVMTDEGSSSESSQSSLISLQVTPVWAHAGSSDNTESPKGDLGRKAYREEQRRLRRTGRLTDITLEEISVQRKGKYEFYLPNTIVCARGSFSQFNAREGRRGSLMPPRTHDCCQTFSTLAAILLSSLGFAVTMQECFDTSTVNYLLYISAWLHQISSPTWPQRKLRPTIGDLNSCLRLREFFPSTIDESEFEVLFYNQNDRAETLVRQLCTSLVKRARSEDVANPICGYVIASGDYTVSIFSLNHDILRQTNERYSDVWSLFLCDSHGTQPWSENKACITGITIAVPRQGASLDKGVVEKEEGLRHFAMILFALLEDHRNSVRSPKRTPYMTWSPVRRERLTVVTAEELKKSIDNDWVPAIMQNPVISQQAEKYRFRPLKCFIGCSAISLAKHSEVTEK
ncbi:hypothetical protein TRVL_02270 [Trypanosoma vivax]|uniref:Uncharacterized protein n=1 Tax=Trypanosoma vivax (strain Y486) TaxID=1055687 RepID=G0U2P8_TRYVY|nr:hypothetical protein TRVL_02270 [Trypanosoma vivax]CCC50551.1 conserved hypothetical protein [Trypanosoma vivax Y486]